MVYSTPPNDTLTHLHYSILGFEGFGVSSHVKQGIR